MFKEVLCFVAVLVLAKGANINNLSRSGSRNTYTLYTQENRRQGVPVDSQSDWQSLFNETRLTIIIVHDHEGSGTTNINPFLKDEILEFQDVNVFVVDWSVYANLGYDNAVAAVPSIAESIALEFISSTLIAGANETPANIHLIGFGLGAHICGIVGRDLNGEIARITGLDPSGRLWGTRSQRLTKTDAQYVEVIHTDGSGLYNIGIGVALGHVDFFINGGGSQPGCSNHNCCHNRAWEIMAASVGHWLTGSRCNSMLQNNLNLCRGVTLEVGNTNLIKRGSGIYRANTRRSYPYV